MLRTRFLVVLCLMVALAAGACNSSDKSTDKTTTSTKTTATAAPATVPSSVPNDVAVRQDVAMTSCAAASGGWQAGGTVSNNRGHDATYTITVFFTSTGATDLSYATASVPVGAGKTASWSAKATFAAPDKVLCVLRGVAAS